MEKVIKYNSEPAKSVKDKKRVLRFIGSTEVKDRDNEVVKSSGWKLANYKKNPVVMVNHQHRELPVAKTNRVWIDKDKKALMFDIEFPEADIHPQGDTLFKLIKNGYMNATSVGFQPNMEKATFANKKGDPSITFNEQELLEISIVSVPANPQALMTAKSYEKAVKDEIVDELELKDLEMWLKENFFEENEEKNIEKDKDPQITDTEDKENTININSTDKLCDECGVKISICSTCFEKKEAEDYFKKIYESLLD
jgi:HK97 family phage prohead protease